MGQGIKTDDSEISDIQGEFLVCAGPSVLHMVGVCLYVSIKSVHGAHRIFLFKYIYRC